MQAIAIQLSHCTYEIHVGHDSANSFGSQLAALLPSRKVCLVTDDNVREFCLPVVEASLREAGFELDVLSIPPGEKEKSLDNATHIWNSLIDQGHTRQSSLISLGGGVVSDLTGFVASTFMRGIPFVALPTSMMSQLDASIGGKTAVNFPQAKNSVGAFYQPTVVLTDTAFLQTLPKRELSSGLAEAVKYGLLIGPDFFHTLQEQAAAIYALQGKEIRQTLHRCITYKASLIEIDEKDQAERMVLNLGHTLGHTIEKLGTYERYRHGEGVAIGLLFAIWVAEALSVLETPDLLAETRSLLQAFQLPVSLRETGFTPDDILATMQKDKKICTDGKIRFILPRKPGEMQTHDVAFSQVKELLQQFQHH